MNIKDSILLGFSFLGFFISVLFLFKKRGDRIANLLLGLLLFSFSFNILYYILFWTKVLPKVLHFNYTYLIPMAIYGPLFYFYVKRIVFKSKFKFSDLIHLVPLLSIFYILRNYLFLSLERKTELARQYLTQQSVDYSTYHEWTLVALLFVYALFSFRLSYYYEINSKPIRNWIRLISLLFLGFALSFVIFQIIYVFIPNIVSFTLYFTIIFIAIIAYFAFMQPEIFSGRRIAELFPFYKYKKSGLTANYSIELRDNLISLLNEEKVYRDSDLSLDILSGKLGTSRHNTSQIVNEHFGLNFFELLNKYRIAEAKGILANDTNGNLTMLDVALEVGFNNRVTFNKIFKKHTLLTPSEYRKSKDKAL